MNSENIIIEARNWLGTRFKHQGRIKNEGCDCLGLIIGVAKNLAIKSRLGDDLALYDVTNYPKLQTSNQLLTQLDKHLVAIRIEDIQVGDVILIKINNWPQHLAIISAIKPHLTIIHSYIQARKIVEQHLPENWNIVASFRFMAFSR